MLKPENFRVVLCSPEGEANMGAVARAMTCFGLTDYVLVSPRYKPGETARNWSCHGLEVLENCRIANTLAEALEDVNIAAGFTRRPGKQRFQMESLEEFAGDMLRHASPGKVALVYGTEDSGLTMGELDLCHRLVCIPTLGSLNLSHAVSISLYELFGRPHPTVVKEERHLASPELRSNMINAVKGHLGAMGYPFHRATLDEEIKKLGNILDRAGLEEWEVNFLGGMFKHLRIQMEEISASVHSEKK